MNRSAPRIRAGSAPPAKGLAVVARNAFAARCPPPGVLGDRWPEEPDHPFPEYRDAPPAPSEAPDELVRAFWALVVVFNLGLFALSLGIMLIAFRGHPEGAALAGGGLALLALGWWRYRRVRARLG